MRRKRDVHIAERARVDHANLSASALLRRSAKHFNAAGEARHKRLECKSRADVGDGDQVVAAAVPDFRQGIVFGQECDSWARPCAALQCRPECSFDVAGATLNLKAVSLHRVCQQRRGIELLVIEFGMSVNILADANQFVAQLVHGSRHCCDELVLLQIRLGQVVFLSDALNTYVPIVTRRRKLRLP